MLTFSQCPNGLSSVVFLCVPIFIFLWRNKSYWILNLPYLNLITLVKFLSPNTITLRIRNLLNKFWECYDLNMMFSCFYDFWSLTTIIPERVHSYLSYYSDNSFLWIWWRWHLPPPIVKCKFRAEIWLHLQLIFYSFYLFSVLSLKCVLLSVPLLFELFSFPLVLSAIDLIFFEVTL